MVYRDFLLEDERLLVVIVAGWGSNPSSIFQFEIVNQKQREALLKPWDDVQICLVDHYMLWFIIIQRWTRRGVCSLFFAWGILRPKDASLFTVEWDMLEFISLGMYSPVATTTQIFLRICYFPRQPASPDVFHQSKHSGMFPEERTNREHRKSRLKRKIVVPTSSFWVKSQLPLSFAGVSMDTVPMHRLETIDKTLKWHRMKHQHVIFQTLAFKPFQKKTWYRQLYSTWSYLAGVVGYSNKTMATVTWDWV